MDIEIDATDMVGDEARAMYDVAMQCDDLDARDAMLERAVATSLNARQAYIDVGACRESDYYTHPVWIRYLHDLSPLRRIIVGDVASYTRSGGVFRRKRHDYAAELGIAPNKLSCHLRDLVEGGYLVKMPEGGAHCPKTPAYTVDIVRCVEEALANGWQPRAWAGNESHHAE